MVRALSQCIALIVAISMIALEAPPTPIRIVGVCCALVGVVVYAWYKLVEKQQQQQQPADEKKVPLAAEDGKRAPNEASALLKP